MFQEWVDLKPASVHLNPEAMTFDNLGDIFFEKKDVFRNLAPTILAVFFWVVLEVSILDPSRGSPFWGCLEMILLWLDSYMHRSIIHLCFWMIRDVMEIVWNCFWYTFLLPLAYCIFSMFVLSSWLLIELEGSLTLWTSATPLMFYIFFLLPYGGKLFWKIVVIFFLVVATIRNPQIAAPDRKLRSGSAAVYLLYIAYWAWDLNSNSTRNGQLEHVEKTPSLKKRGLHGSSEAPGEHNGRRHAYRAAGLRDSWDGTVGKALDMGVVALSIVPTGRRSSKQRCPILALPYFTTGDMGPSRTYFQSWSGVRLFFTCVWDAGKLNVMCRLQMLRCFPVTMGLKSICHMFFWECHSFA